MTKTELIDLLEPLHPRSRLAKAKKSEDIKKFLDDEYPGVSLNYQIISLLNNVDPYCAVCKSPVKTLYRLTCSVTCREFLKISNNSYVNRNEKIKKTLIERHGVDNPAKLDSTKEKRKNTMLERYGALVSEKSRESARSRAGNLNTLGKETLMKRYGVDNPAKIEGHYQRSRETYLLKNGVEHYTKTEEFLENSKIKRYRLMESVFPNNIDLLDISDSVDKSHIFENPNRIIRFFCHSCKVEDSAPSETVKWRLKHTATPCRNCSGLTSGSRKENEIAEFIKALGIRIDRNKKILDGLEIDIYCPDINIGIEFHGLYWHNDTRVEKSYHLRKLRLAESKGIRLIQIFEDEWEHRRNIVESRLKNLFGMNSRKIYARQCKIKTITSQEEREFLESNHIQGYARSSVRYALTYNDQIVSVMSFSIPNISRGIKSADKGHWELLRFSNLTDTTVIGSASRLFNFFLKQVEVSSIISYSDLRWNTGELYRTLKFSKMADTPIGYWYVNSKEIRRIHRYTMRKNSSDDPSLSEYQNRLNQGYLRIWDCGNSKWVWSATERNILPTEEK